MAQASPRLKVLSVGGNAVSAFLSWRLQATNACDVTLVWKSGFDSVAQYGVSFRSQQFGNERFKPRAVVRNPEEAAFVHKGAFDYVVLCVKALPDVYDLASVIAPVVTPQHTCILINTSHSLGVEAMIEERFPKNVVLSLVSAADIVQLGPAEFEHRGSTEMWVGPANHNSDIPASIQVDMSEALAMTLGSGHVQCKVSKNIQQQQFERMAGPIAFHTTSVLFETPNHADLLELTGVRSLILAAIDEIMRIAEARGCQFAINFKDSVVEEMIVSKDTNSIMYQDYAARRPMEIETYLGSPLKLARSLSIAVPRLETLYAMLHHVNSVNQKRTPTPPIQAGPPVPTAFNGPSANGSFANGPPLNGPPPMSRMSSAPLPRGPGGPGMNGHMGPPMRGRGSRAPSMTGPPPGMRRGPPQGMNGMHPPRGMGQMQRRPSFEQNGLDEFSYLSMYADDSAFPDGGEGAQSSDLAMRERELILRQKELALREREMGMNMRGPGPRPRPPPSHADFEDEDDGEDYFDPMAYRGPPVDPEQVDMMSITSRRTRKQPSIGQLRQNPEFNNGQQPRRGAPYGRPGLNRNRTSSRMIAENMSGIHDSVIDNPLMGYSSDRYGDVDRKALGRESRTNSLTATRLTELQQGSGYNGYPPMARRASQSPGNPFGPSSGGPMPGPAQNYPGSPHMGAPSYVRQPIPRHPPGQGNTVAPQQVEQRAGVSNLHPPKNSNQVRSLTGSASASAGSGDSGRSAHIESENSAHSSQSSLGARPPIGVR